MFRTLTVLLLTVGLATPALAGGVRESGNAAARALAQQAPRPQMDSRGQHRSYLWPGAIAFVAGMGLATYGFLHTTDGDYVEPSDASKLANTKLGVAGLALAAGGGAMMFVATRPGVSASPSKTAAAPSVSIGRRFSW